MSHARARPPRRAPCPSPSLTVVFLALVHSRCAGSAPSDAGVADVAAACTPAPPSDPPDGGPHPGRIFVSTSDYTSGSLRALAPDGGVSGDLVPLTGDSVLAWHGRTLVALNYSASGQDNVTFVDVATDPPAVRSQVAMRRAGERGGGNARGYAPLCENRGLVARFNQSDLALVDPVAGTFVEGANVSLRGFALNDSLPYPDGLAWIDNELWVAVARLPPGLTNPTAPGVIAVFDPATSSLRDLDPATAGVQGIELRHANPVGGLARAGREVWVACPGAYQMVGDGAVEAIDPSARRSVRDVVTEAEVGGNIDALAVLDGERVLLRVAAQAVGSGLDIETVRLVEWNTRTRENRVWLTLPHYAMTAPLVGPDGRVYVGDRGDEVTGRPSGVRVFNPSGPPEVTTAPISLGLPPYQLVSEGR